MRGAPFLVALALLAPSGRGLARAAACEGLEIHLVSTEILVVLEPGVVIEDVIADYPEHQLAELDRIPALRLHRLAAPPGTPEGVLDLIREDLKRDDRGGGRVKKSDRHRHVETPEGVQRGIVDLTRSVTLNDFTGQPAAGILGVPSEASPCTGRGVTVAVVDTASAHANPVTAGSVVGAGLDLIEGTSTADVAANGLDDDADGMMDEMDQHGTFVAGLVHLAAPGARILHVRVLDDDGRGESFTVARGIVEAVQRGADVVNLSFGLTHDPRGIEEAIEFASAHGAVVVGAAGNRNLECLDWPAVRPEVIAVAAVSDDLTKAPFSSYGPEVDLTAPGVDLVSVHGQSEFGHWDGTSFATPLVAGGAALLLEKYPGLAPDEVRSLLRQAAQPDNADPSFDGLLGAGVLDLGATCDVLAADRTSLKLRDTSAGTVGDWSPVLGATAYDLVRGNLENLRSGGLDVDLGPITCIASDVTGTDTTAFPDPELPGDGKAFFYLFRDDAAAAPGEFGASSDGRARTSASVDCPP